MKILTISIAAYNMEGYIRQALDSLIDERVIDDLEIFVVDDGGTDGTLEIAKEYAEKYPRSIIPVHKENGGYGTTVNYSIAHATGKYFKLLDGDDWFDTESLCQMIGNLRQMDVDVVFSPYKKVYENHGSVERIRIITLDGYKNGDVIPINDTKKLLGMWAIIYRTEVLRQSRLKLPSHTLYTDTVYSVVPLTCCKNAIFLDTCLYQYRMGRTGQSVGREAKVRHADDEKKIAKILCTFYMEQKERGGTNLERIKRSAAEKYCMGIIVILLAPVCSETRQRLRDYEAEVGALSPEIYKFAERIGKIGILLWLLRRTNYMAYWLLKLIPGGFPDRV